MWSIVAFEADNSVEVVPSNWFDKELCAWPKKNLRSYIDNQISPDEKCFRFLNARKLGKDINSYKIAEEKANRAKLTSDLSTNESSQENLDRNKPKLKRKVSLDKETKNGLWSPNSDDIFDDSDVDPMYSPVLNNVQGKLSSPKLHSSASLPVLARKKLNFDICSSGDQNKIKKINTNGKSVSPKPFSTEYQSSLSYSNPRKKICLSASPSKLNKTQEFKNADQSHATSKFDNIKHTTIISTSSSPFKVTHDESFMASTSQITQNKQMNNNRDNSTLEKMNRNILNLKYDIRSLHEKVDKLEEIILNNNIGYNKEDSNFEADSFQTLLNTDFPLEDENALQTFENKLLDNNFRMKLVTELSRYVRNTLPSTIRSMMRFLFKDSLLEEYSYKGQKKKKVFSTLGVTSIIFDAVKNMKRYQKYDKIDVEQPIKIFIAGAKFRSNKIVE